MNPPNSNEESENSAQNSNVNIHLEESEPSDTQGKRCCNVGNKLCIIFEKLLITVGLFLILIFVFGLFGLHSDDNAETFFLITAGTFLILGTYTAGKRYRRLQNFEPPSGPLTSSRREQIVRGEDNNIYILSIADDRVGSPPFLIRSGNCSFPPPSLSPNFAIPGVHAPKPSKIDNPPSYDDVVAAPPPYETLQADGGNARY